MSAMTNKEAAGLLRREQTMNCGSDFRQALDLAIEALDPWQPPRAVLPWVSVEDHPHPTDGTMFLAKWPDCSMSHLSTKFVTSVTHWCALPEGEDR